jgi:DNA-binding NarL/FixJ family response regulator/tetratricopeptide (TPR) repeat protein
MPGATVLVTAQHKSGVASSVREWLDGSGKKLVVWSSNRLEVPENAPDADVVLLEVEGMRTDHATATLAVREHWPNATLIAISSTQWPPELLDAGLRPERVFAGALFGFTADEVLDRAEQLGFSLAWDEATALLERVGTHAGFVDAVLRAAAARGSLDEEAVRAGCHEQAAYFGGSAAAGVFRPNGWYAALVTARIGPMPRRTLLRVWGRDEVVRAALDNIMQSGFFVEDLVSDTIELRPAIRAAIIERITREAQLDSVDEAIVELATKLLDEGNPGDGWAIVADRPGPRARLLTRYWWHLGEVDVERARPWLEQAVQRDPEPALRVALARALVSVTSAGHSGSVPAADRQAARDLLEEVGEQPGGVGVAATLLRGVLLRLDGRYREALELHEELANTAEVSDDVAATTLRTNMLLQAGLSALDASRPDVAAARLSAAASLARAAGHDRLARFAHELMLFTAPDGVPMASGFQARLDNLVGAQALSRPMRGVVELSNALYVVDPDAMRDALAASDTIDDPRIMAYVSLVLRTIAHGLLGTSELALRRIDLFEHDAQSADLAPQQRVILAWARAEALAGDGQYDAASTAIAQIPEAAARVVPVDLLRARTHLRGDEPERAIACLASTADAHGSGVLAVWSHVVLFLAYHAIGSASSLDVARQHLQVAMVAAARSRPMLPFAAQGMSALNTTLAEAAGLALDPAGSRFVRELERMRDELQRATSSTLALSDRERTVVRALVEAESTRDLAARLHVSPNTIKTQLRSIYRKLGVSSWADAVATAKRVGLAE